ncbi:HAD-IA family hydrolase [Rugosimonospora acidiphila]|uniref:HAD-IA family hydrolase n=1 Tax=Rugosimonospora acidiphila TaxID=556531 RepID=A0ABP9RJ52_9ACTN
MPHLVWDWNGTLLDDLTLVVAATNASLAACGGPAVTADEHRRDFRRPVADYYGGVLGRPIDEEEFARLDKTFHLAYSDGLPGCPLSAGALDTLRSWAGSQSLLSMWFHEELVPTVERYGLNTYFARVDGLRGVLGGGFKAPHLANHLREQGLKGADCVLIGDSVDDAVAAQSVGARCVLYSGGFTDRARLVATGVPVVDTLAEAALLAARPAA